MSGPSHTLLSHLHRLHAPVFPDAILLARWRDQRDQAAFALLTARHGPMVLGVCRRILGDVQDAEEAFQATFVVLAGKAGKLRRPEALASFLYGVALRIARKARAGKRRRLLQPPPQAPEPVDPRPQPLDVLTNRELLALLDVEIARLPETYRLPLVLCLLQGRTIEVAAAWGFQMIDYSHSRVNQSIPDKEFRLDEEPGVKDVKAQPLDQDYTSRFLRISDGSNGRMTVRWGEKGPKGTRTSGLN